jgi:UDP-N-acetylmuramyl tripeptide synthase
MDSFSILLGKGIQKISKLRGGGGSALPGLVIEKTNPNFLKKTLSRLPYGVVVISGTNGKTTTTKIVSELLAKQGLKVFTNKTGSNFVRGAISAVLEEIKINGKFDYDIAVLELDEAHAVKFCETVPVNYSLVLNVQRDQLDRFGEIDHTAELLEKLTSCTKKCTVLNREDSRVAKLSSKKKIYYGLSAPLLKSFPNDDNLLDAKSEKSSNKKATVTLEKLKGQIATYDIEGQKFSCDLTLKGIYNAYNAAGALALCHEIMPEIPVGEFIKYLDCIESAFGRGEVFKINDVEVELLLVKNPSAFQLSLASFVDKDHDYMIAINDEIADGRDVSWLWNVDFTSLESVKLTSGTRATDMALRLKYDGVKTDAIVEDLKQAVTKFTSTGKKPKRIFTTYTAMLELRKIISGKSLV